MKHRLTDIWYRKSLHPAAILLLPFSYLFFICVFIRRWLYKTGLLKIYYFNPPVIVVGNLSVGGTGKTPFVIALAKFLQTQGYKPGIVTRGVGGKKRKHAYLVNGQDSPAKVGDEAILLVENTQCPVVIGINRAEAVQVLLENSNCNIVISDDGLQHYRLDRDMEIVMVDHERRFGNQYLLPAGPLREKKSRAAQADLVVVNGGDENNEYTLQLEPLECVSVVNPSHVVKWEEFPRGKIHAAAGIGHPDRFFQVLENAGFDIIPHTFPDHHLYQAFELDFADKLTIIMTEKDAVKCREFADERFWFLRVDAKMDTNVEQAILTRIKKIEADNEHKNTFGNLADNI